jgi:hypothetical protein
MQKKEFKVKQIGKPLKEEKKPSDDKTLGEVFDNQLNEFQTAFMEQKKKEQKQAADSLSTGFLFCAYFADAEQCQEFLTKAKLQPKMEAQYINGQMMADILGINITKKKINPPKSFRKHKDFTNMIIK